jgi:hypothetical protein
MLKSAFWGIIGKFRWTHHLTLAAQQRTVKVLPKVTVLKTSGRLLLHKVAMLRNLATRLLEERTRIN